MHSRENEGSNFFFTIPLEQELPIIEVQNDEPSEALP